TRKGRGYGKYDNKSHGTPWPPNAPEFWAVRKSFMDKYGVTYKGFGEAAPADAAARREQTRENLAIAFSILESRPQTVGGISHRIAAAADSVPDRPASFNLGGSSTGVFSDPAITDYE